MCSILPVAKYYLVLLSWESIVKEGFGASRSGNEFSAIHGDLMIK